MHTYEYVGNLHAHTTYSDGAKPHDVVAASAIRAGLDFLVTTDHNVLVQGVEGRYRSQNGREVLLLTGEEIHDMLREPQRNHLLVYGTGRELAAEAQGRPPQHLLNAVNAAGGCAFLAHPIDRAVPWAGEGSYSWEDWDISGYTGIELWNYMSSLKTLLTDPLAGVAAVLDPGRAMIGPDPEILGLWDMLLAQGKRVAVIGNSDAHATIMHAGPVRKVVLPYEFLFRAVNTHILLAEPLSGDPYQDASAIFGAIAQGHAFVGHGIPGDPRGFRFEALHVQSAASDGTAQAAVGEPVGIMGDACPLADVDLLRMTTTVPARLRLITQGEVVAETTGQTLTYRPEQPGPYRAEAWRTYRGQERGWVFSNPIYLTP